MPKCIETNKLANFVKKAHAIHGQYDYSEAIYKHSHTHLVIICHTHGPFRQSPSNHLQGSGCAQCALINRRASAGAAFVKRAAALHGRFDYSKSVYKDSRTPLLIICPKHGEFLQLPGVHLKGHGCPKCGRETCVSKHTHTLAAFVKKASAIHGHYDYSKAVYKDSKTPVLITCPLHGAFRQSPNNHLRGKGCPKCGREKFKTTLADFVKRATAIHGRYDYSKAVYHNTATPLVIVCPKHGHFRQRPNSHLQGRGCFQCGREKCKTTPADFVKRAAAIHGQYDYSKAVYKHCQTPLVVVCPKHGDFRQTPSCHLQGHGCHQCKTDKCTGTLANFVKRATTMHGQYDYSKAVYKDSRTPLVIICPKHGHFRQRPAEHLQGQGCPHCNESKGEKRVAQTLSELELSFARQVKCTECRDKRPLPFDFLVRIGRRRGFLIEYQGQHHYQAVRYGRMSHQDAQRRLNAVRRRDRIKREWCKKNAVPLLCIPYWRSIPDLIQEFLPCAAPLPARLVNCD